MDSMPAGFCEYLRNPGAQMLYIQLEEKLWSQFRILHDDWELYRCL